MDRVENYVLRGARGSQASRILDLKACRQGIPAPTMGARSEETKRAEISEEERLRLRGLLSQISQGQMAEVKNQKSKSPPESE